MLGVVVKFVVGALLIHYLMFIVDHLMCLNIIYNHSPGSCRAIEGVKHGSEDIEILSNGLCFITTNLNYFNVEINDTFYDSKLLLIDLNYPKNKPIALKIIGNFDSDNFRPHGISSWVEKSTGVITLFVVNHAPDCDRLEVFKFDGKDYVLEHLKSLTDPSMYALNDIVAVSAVTFYFTNDGILPFRYRFFNIILSIFPIGSIGYFNGRTFIMMQDWIHMVNGINISPDKKYLYVSSPSLKSVLIYEIKKDKSINLNVTIPLQSIIDNINIDHLTGNLWIAAHPIFYQFVYRIFISNYPSSSKVFRLSMNGPTNVSYVTEVYSNNGNELSTSSVAAYFKNQLLIGSVDDKLLYCQVKTLS